MALSEYFPPLGHINMLICDVKSCECRILKKGAPSTLFQVLIEGSIGQTFLDISILLPYMGPTPGTRRCAVFSFDH